MTELHADIAPAAPKGMLPRPPLRLSCVVPAHNEEGNLEAFLRALDATVRTLTPDRKSTRLNSSHSQISYAVFCLKKKNKLTVPLGRTLKTHADHNPPN